MVRAFGVFLFWCSFVYSQYAPSSPCPNVFEYHQQDYQGWYGVITIQPFGPVNQIDITVNFTVSGLTNGDFLGKLEPFNTGTALHNFNRGRPLKYQMTFPTQSQLPRITSIVCNGIELCYSPNPDPYVSKVSVSHRLHTTVQTHTVNNPTFTRFPIRTDDDGYSVSGVKYTYTQSENGGPPQTITGTLGNTGSISDIDSLISSIRGTNVDITKIKNELEKFHNGAGSSIPDRFNEPALRPSMSEVPTPEQQPPPRPRPEQRPKPRPPPRVTTTTTTTPPPPPPPPPVTQTSTALSPSSECGLIAGGNDIQALIYSGKTYPRGEWPWVVALYKTQRPDSGISFICGGTLITHKHVLSAAHCIHLKDTRTDIEDLVVRVGVYNLQKWGEDMTYNRDVVSATKYEHFNSWTLEHDIVVITMDRTVPFSALVRPVCLWSGITAVPRIVGESGVVIGWGRSADSEAGRGEPRMLYMPVVGQDQCRSSAEVFHKLVTNYTICAGERNGAGPCSGDSGGGFYMKQDGLWRIRAIVSVSLKDKSGARTCSRDDFYVFTDVAQYLPWIRRVLAASI